MRTAAYWRAYRKRRKAKDPDYYKDRSLRQRYGITLDTRKKMATKQRNRCAICRRKVALVVDHDHKTGRVRGLLCNSCNRAIGLLSTQRLLNAAKEYLT